MCFQKMGLKLVVFAIGFLFGVSPLHAAAPVTLTPVAEYTNTSNVHDILLTEDAVWAATDGGLVSYHRQHLNEQKRIASKEGLFGNALRTIVQTAPGTLVVGGDFGHAEIGIGGKNSGRVTAAIRHTMDSFDPVIDFLSIDNKLFALGFQTGLSPLNPSNKTTAIDTGKFFWNTGAVQGHIVALGAADGTFVQYDLEQRRTVYTLRFATPVIKVVPYKEGFLIATQRELYSYLDGISHPVRVQSGARSSAIQATCMAPVAASHVFIGTADGVVFELKEDALDGVVKYHGHRITAIVPGTGHLWLGISQKGLARYAVDSGETAFLRDASEICSNHVTQSVYHGNTLVVRTFDSGACYLSTAGWQMLPAGKSKYVHGLASDGKTLVVTDSDGITLYDENLKPIDESLYLTGSMRWLGKSAALSAVSPRNGLFFIASPFGMVRLERVRDRFKTTFWKKKRGIPGDITALAADEANLYIGTESRGVRVFTHNGKFVTDYMDPTHLPEAWTMTLTALKDSLVVGTCQHGVATINRGEQVAFHNAASGLADNRIIATAPFNNGAFVGSLHGLSLVGNTSNRDSDYHFNRLAAPDPRAASLFVYRQTLLYSTEFGLITYKISGNDR